MDLLDAIKEEETSANNSLKIQNEDVVKEAESIITNGLSSALMGQDIFSQGAQISQADTMFKSARWYLISNFRQVLSEMYVENGLIQTIVNVPVDDGFRGGVKIKSEQLSEDEIKGLENYMEEQDDLNMIGQALKWNRLFGGAGILIMTNQEPEKPLDLNAKLDDLEFRAVDMWELYHETQNLEGEMNYGIMEEQEFYSYYGQKVHKSRVLILKGKTPPSFLRPRLRGWGFSVIESFVRSINQYLKATDLTFEVLDEFKLDIYKIKGLTNALLSPTGEKKINDRVRIANQQKNYQNAITMDSEDDYVQKQLAFSGLSETMDGIRKQVASDLRMPMTKLFGVSSAGFSSGEDDIENYNSMIESEIRSKSKFHILKVIKIRCLQLFGHLPEDMEIEFESLRVLSSEQEENVKNSKHSRLLASRQANEITTEEFRAACNKDDLLGIRLEEGEDIIESLKDSENNNDNDRGMRADAPKASPKSATTAPEAPAPK